jgi:excisionase family DNA binding protein
MLMHEWLKYRDRHFKREPVPEADLVASLAEPLPEEAPPEAPPAAPAPELFEEEAAPPPAPAEPEAPPPEPVSVAPPRPAPARVPMAPSDLHAPEFQTRRLQTLLSRQQRLPLELEEEERPSRGTPAARESREDLIERLLDPVLSIDEAATLLGVCATSVRRYTNRGVLRCFRTPGNQRRFRLSEVLDFMEKQQSSDLD